MCRRTAPRLRPRPSLSANGWRGELPRTRRGAADRQSRGGEDHARQGHRAAACGAAPPDEVSSPTFTLIHEYGGGRVYHIDLYRLDEPREVATLGSRRNLRSRGLVLIEWGERFPQLMPRGAHRDPAPRRTKTTKGKSKSDTFHEQTTLGPDSGRQQRIRRGHRAGTGARRHEHFRRPPGPARQASARRGDPGEDRARSAASASSSTATPPTTRSARRPSSRSASGSRPSLRARCAC